MSYAKRGAKLVQERSVRLVQVRAAPQRSVSVGQRASAVHGRCAVVHGPPGARAYDVLLWRFEKGVLTRCTGGILVFSPPSIIEGAQIDEIFRTVAEVLRETAGRSLSSARKKAGASRAGRSLTR
ncbi:hypothetical protein [Paraburkholderia sediminicola]|uniref:hypothetical protein n=1 Tax=Paraburkholderia sediminicola TaxID=458836 RepID=UPI003898F58C